MWDQFRDGDGSPIHPQRPKLLGPLFTQGAAGTLPTGDITGKMIVVACLLDREAFPWQADWYRSRVEEHLGSSTPDRFRLWFIDNALHGDDDEQEFPDRSVSYLGALETALTREGIHPEDLVITMQGYHGASWVAAGYGILVIPGYATALRQDGTVVLPLTPAHPAMPPRIAARPDLRSGALIALLRVAIETADHLDSARESIA